jgi:hypothetical protein
LDIGKNSEEKLSNRGGGISNIGEREYCYFNLSVAVRKCPTN